MVESEQRKSEECTRAMEEEYARKNETTSYITVRVDARDGDWDWLKGERETPMDHVADLKNGGRRRLARRRALFTCEVII